MVNTIQPHNRRKLFDAIEGMTDSELNKELMFLSGEFTKSQLERNSGIEVHYCSDWNLTMQLAIKNKISLNYHDDLGIWSTDQTLKSQGGIYYTAFKEDKNDGLNTKNSLRCFVVTLVKILTDKSLS
ncbi:hypothetical protein [Vibrio sp. D431a]|uniref:hypothetical protein n=1 Tax=Vibrio sp. D431a TaxID=2837388 RepID=UPI00255677D5|nr:hypothetical protein [Vibrio sp. D431a]MDK9789810.1 hypothetical protein [Vibrio sp. D431a]